MSSQMDPCRRILYSTLACGVVSIALGTFGILAEKRVVHIDHVPGAIASIDLIAIGLILSLGSILFLTAL